MTTLAIAKLTWLVVAGQVSSAQPIVLVPRHGDPGPYASFAANSARARLTARALADDIVDIVHARLGRWEEDARGVAAAGGSDANYDEAVEEKVRLVARTAACAALEVAGVLDGAQPDWCSPQGAAPSCGAPAGSAPATRTCPVSADPPGSEFSQPAAWMSRVEFAFPAQFEVVNLTSDADPAAPFGAEFHQRLAGQVLQKFDEFRTTILPHISRLNPDGRVLGELRGVLPGAENDAFFHWQKRLFEEQGDEGLAALDEEPPGWWTPSPDAPATWPEMHALSEWHQLRRVLGLLSRRYLRRVGLAQSDVDHLRTSLFGWAGVHRDGSFHGPHTHMGEFHVASFYAQVPEGGAPFILIDPRQSTPPFAKQIVLRPRPGQVVMFPAWMSHMASSQGTATSSGDQSVGRQSASDSREDTRVALSFNIGPVTGAALTAFWHEDPTSNTRLTSRSRIDLAAEQRAETRAAEETAASGGQSLVRRWRGAATRDAWGAVSHSEDAERWGTAGWREVASRKSEMSSL